MRVPDDAKLWSWTSTPITRVSMAGAGALRAVAPDTFRRWHDGGARDPCGRPPMNLPPFAPSRLGTLTHAVSARLSLSVPSWQHVNRRVLRELDIEFEPSSQWTRQFLRSLQLSFHTRHGPSEADIARERKLLPSLCDRLKISQDRTWNLDETAVRTVPAGERGWSKRAESAHVFAARFRHGHVCCKHERRHVDTDCLSGEDRPSAPSWTTLSAPARDPLSDALDHAGHSPGHDRRDLKSNVERVNLDSSTSVLRQLIRAHCSRERRQPVTSSCWLALHRLAAPPSCRSKTSSGDGRTVSTRHSRGASRARGRSH